MSPKMMRSEAEQPRQADGDRGAPDPLTQQPPADRYCDLVLNGGVASGVVYPWAIVELARHYRFQSIGGTSVGAVAAALTAASEYGRCMGVAHPFEVLRRVPGDLAETQPDGRPKMLSLFQPTARGRRLFRIVVEVMTLASTARQSGSPGADATPLGGVSVGAGRQWLGIAKRLVHSYLCDAVWNLNPFSVAGLALALLGLGLLAHTALLGALALIVGGGLLLLGLAVGLFRALADDLVEGVLNNDLGFCRGLRQPGESGPAFVDWMHKGIQQAAGLREADRPLTFADLWYAPRLPGESLRARSKTPLERRDRRIDLQVVVSNVTHGRPYLFPLTDESSQLYFKPEEWDELFPASVMQWLRQVARPYAPKSYSDPAASLVEGLLELPAGDMPVVVAARMSMGFPVLFSAVPVYAVDYEAPRPQSTPGAQGKAPRQLRPCRLADGGLCSNFPIHFFDAAIPRWPTFGIWLAQRLSAFAGSDVWLPTTHLQGRADNWLRFEPRTQDSEERSGAAKNLTVGTIANYLLSVGLTMKDWNDRTHAKLPHVRTRVARMALRANEGQLYIAMPAQQILDMAARYGTAAGIQLARAFGDTRTPQAPTPAWAEHRYVRTHLLVQTLREYLRGVGDAMDDRAHALSIAQLLERARAHRPLSEGADRQGEDASGSQLDEGDVDSLLACLATLRDLEVQLLTRLEGLPYSPLPAPELRLRSPL
jgi:predicted acylesterase/phospholipase RssA